MSVRAKQWAVREELPPFDHKKATTFATRSLLAAGVAVVTVASCFFYVYLSSGWVPYLCIPLGTTAIFSTGYMVAQVVALVKVVKRHSNDGVATMDDHLISIHYFDRETKELREENIYGKRFLTALYQKRGIHNKTVKHFVVRNAFASEVYGRYMKSTHSAKQIRSFADRYEIDTSEIAYDETKFDDPLASFPTFNAFFIRKLKPEARPIDPCKAGAVMPADGRYLIYPNISCKEKFAVKNQPFSLAKLIDNPEIAQAYKGGSLVIARLCPSDYHRFHFPFDAKVMNSRQITGRYDSVSPIALHKKIDILTENKREVSTLNSSLFGEVLYIEVGATNVGTIYQTAKSTCKTYKKGAEKGYFSFGGSTVILVFKKDTIKFSEDLLQNSSNDVETFCKMGTPLGVAIDEEVTDESSLDEL